VREAEFVLVPIGGPEALSHGQIRFIFDEGGIELLAGSESVGEAEKVDDLVFSWEAWRAPGVDFDVMKGMSDATFTLSLRAYSGTQRFLEDALGNRPWKAYTLDLPGGREGVEELLRVTLALGDGAARSAIGALLDEAGESWVVQGPDSAEASEEWRRLRERARDHPAPEDPLLDMSGNTGYQSLVRSCATVALYCVNVATVRLLEKEPAPGKRPTQAPTLEGDPDWMADLAGASLAGVFLRGPRLIRFLAANPTVIPSEIPWALGDAGLLALEDGDPRVREYEMSGETPWGHRDQLLVK
jgi:hypothetical protein